MVLWPPKPSYLYFTLNNGEVLAWKSLRSFVGKVQTIQSLETSPRRQAQNIILAVSSEGSEGH